MEPTKKPTGPSQYSEVNKYSTSRYPYRLNFYSRPPLGDVTLENFEGWAIDRLKVLAEIEASFVRNRSHDDLKKVTKSHSDKYLPLRANTAQEGDRESERLKDHVSHFILRLAFCRTAELKRRFIKAETTLFRVRLETDDAKERTEFLNQDQSIKLDYLTNEEKDTIREELVAATFGITPANLSVESFIKIPWTKVPILVDKRRIYLRKGLAYVPLREMSTIIVQEFQTRLEKAMDATEKALPRLDEDDRIIPILDHLGKGFLAGVSSDYIVGDEIAEGDAVTADMVDDLSNKHWPLCMRHLHQVLKREHLLKHHARLQYGLFLKAVGMSVEEAIRFWQKSFSEFSTDKFNKDYRYNIRHTYGLEGRRANYPAQSCQKILTSDSHGPQDSHGCPFKRFDIENLTTTLSSYYRITAPQDVLEIQNAIKGLKYHIACTRVFEITHAYAGVKKGDGVGGGESVTHPNQYTARSRELERDREPGGIASTNEDSEMEVDV